MDDHDVVLAGVRVQDVVSISALRLGAGTPELLAVYHNLLLFQTVKETSHLAHLAALEFIGDTRRSTRAQRCRATANGPCSPRIARTCGPWPWQTGSCQLSPHRR